MLLHIFTSKFNIKANAFTKENEPAHQVLKKKLQKQTAAPDKRTHIDSCHGIEKINTDLIVVQNHHSSLCDEASFNNVEPRM